MESEFWELYNLLIAQKPQISDVVVWLQGDRYDRVEKVLEMYRSGLSRKIVLSGNNIQIGPGKKIGEDNVSLADMESYILEQGVPTQDLILEDKSLNTKEQAVRVLELAKEMQWKSITIVTSAYHQPRTFLTFLKQEKEINWGGKIYNLPAVFELDSEPGGRTVKVSELIPGEIEKIKMYSADLVPIEEGLSYLKNTM